jgi:hypothetical protein
VLWIAAARLPWPSFLIASLYVFYALKKLYKRTQKTENRPFFVMVLPAAASVTPANA